MPYKRRNCDREYCENNSCAESSLASSQEPEPKNTVGKSEGDLKGMFYLKSNDFQYSPYRTIELSPFQTNFHFHVWVTLLI